MIYKYAAKANYEHLAAGTIIKSYKGNTNFPVRLGHEIFNRCLSHCENKDQVTLYDPMCGSAYLLTVIGLLNFEKIKTLYASDIDEQVMDVAKRNLRLLTVEGIEEREKELMVSLENYKRESYTLALKQIHKFQSVVQEDLEFELFRNDIFECNSEITFKPDIIIMDLPYNNVVKLDISFSSKVLEERIFELSHHNTITAVVSNKAQNLQHDSLLKRVGQFKVGHRKIEILKKVY